MRKKLKREEKETEKVSFRYKRKTISVDVRVCGFFERFSGLMFKKRKEAKALLFEFKNPGKTKIHSFFVFFSFVAVWLDRRGRVLGVRKVSPFRISVSVPENKNFARLIEIPFNRKYSRTVKFLVGKRKI